MSGSHEIGDKDPAFVLWAGSFEAANKWEKLIHVLAEEADENAETGYNTDPLNDELGLLCWQTDTASKQSMRNGSTSLKKGLSVLVFHYEPSF
jgi:hypothetical protein